MGMRIKDKVAVQAILSNLKVEPAVRHKLVCFILGMVIGKRLNLPSSLAPYDMMANSNITRLWQMLCGNEVAHIVSDFNEVYVHDVTETKRLSEVFWTIRYANAAPCTTMTMPVTERIDCSHLTKSLTNVNFLTNRF
jgi:predicted P-loop ATPase/GTPase